jgi:hypothetical protein
MDVLLDFLYVIFQRRLSSARYLIKSGLSIALVFLGVGSLVGSVSYEGFSLNIDSGSSSVIPFIVNSFAIIGLISLVAGTLLEIYERFWGEASKDNRAKSIDLRSLSQANAPKLSKSFPSLVESAGIHNDLFLIQHSDESLSNWLQRSTTALTSFAKDDLVKINHYESDHPLALGALAHVPHCFALGFLIANRRLAHYYCWNRDRNKSDKSRWIDCRDKRTKGQSTNGFVKTVMSSDVDTPEEVKKLGLSIEMSITSKPEDFLTKIGLDAVCQIGLENQDIGNLFSEKEQVKIIGEIRTLLNNDLFKKYPKIEELHITITAQASFVMRFGADLNQNHFPSVIKVYHFENQKYPWCFNVSPNKTDVEYSVL